jgi:ketosteroid isomerase-like protein
MSHEDVEILRELYARWAHGDFATVEMFDREVEFARIAADAPGTAGEWRGVEQMWIAWVDWLRSWDGVRFEAERFIELSDRVLVLSRHFARGKRSGVVMDRESGDIFTLRDGKIVRWECYWDRAEAVAVAGVELD